MPCGATDVAVDHLVKVSAKNGHLTSVAVSSRSGSIAGKMSGDGQSWTAGGLLEPSTSYTVVSSAVRGRQDRDPDHPLPHRTAHARPADLPSIARCPVDGLGMPVT